jgi:uncharacterized phage protein gp47/JayE
MFWRPTITQLRDQAINDVLIGTGFPTLLRRSPLRAMAYAIAALANGLYGYLDWIARQSTPFTATGAFLEAWGALVGITRLPGTAATGTASGTGTGLVVGGTAFRRSDGSSYTTQADVTLSGSGTVSLIAADSGAVTTLTTGEQLVLASPVAGVNGTWTAANGTPGADVEADTSLRTRILARYAAPPQGGDSADYLGWALAVPGVTRAWINPLGMGAGTVVVYVMLDQAEAAHQGFPQGVNGVAIAESRDTPATGDQLAVANALYPQRPATALVYVVAPVPQVVNFTIHPKTPVSSPVQGLVINAIDVTFLAHADALGGELETSPFEAAIAAVPGMPDFTVTAPSGAITPALGHLPVRGTITYV